jgi:hypothetical protein
VRGLRHAVNVCVCVCGGGGGGEGVPAGDGNDGILLSMDDDYGAAESRARASEILRQFRGDEVAVAVKRDELPRAGAHVIFAAETLIIFMASKISEPCLTCHRKPV